MGKLEVSNPAQAFLCMVETKDRCEKMWIMDRALKCLFVVYLWSHVWFLCDPMDCSQPASTVRGISQDKNTRMGCHSLLQGIFPTQGSNLSLLHWRLNLYFTLLAGRFFTAEPPFQNTGVQSKVYAAHSGLTDSSEILLDFSSRTLMCCWNEKSFAVDFGEGMALVWACQVVLVVKNLPANIGDGRDWVKSLGWEDPLE